jgi:predicted transcriptional regulator
MLISYEGMARWPEKIYALTAPAQKEVVSKYPEEILQEKKKSNFKHLLKTLEWQRKLRRHFFCLAC